MRQIVLILSLSVACAGMACAGAESNLMAELKAICGNTNQLPESLVRPASLLVQQRYVHKPWNQVRTELCEQGLSVPEGRDVQYFVDYDVPIATNVLTIRNISFDLVLEFRVDLRTKEMVPTARSNHIATATASLRADIGVPTTALLSSGIFPASSVLGRALAAPVTQERNGGHRILKRIQMSYDLIRGHRESEWPYGYHLSLFFGDLPAGDWKRRVFLTVLSMEDLPRDREDNVVRNWHGWTLTGLDDIHFWGSNGE